MASSTMLFGDLKRLIDESLLEERCELRDRLAVALRTNRQQRRKLAAAEQHIDELESLMLEWGEAT